MGEGGEGLVMGESGEASGSAWRVLQEGEAGMVLEGDKMGSSWFF